MKETQENSRNSVRPWHENDEVLEQVLSIIPGHEEGTPESDWEHGYFTGINDSRDVMRVRVLQLFRRDYQRIPDRIEDTTPREPGDPAGPPPSRSAPESS